MKITAEIKKIFDDESKVKAAATIVIEDVFVVRNVRLIDGIYGMFVSMPSYRNTRGEYKAVCFSVSNELRTQIFNEVLTAYENLMANHVDEESAAEQTTAQ